MCISTDMDNLQELFTYQTVQGASCTSVHSPVPQTLSTSQAQLQLQAYAGGLQATSATCGPKESIIYATPTATSNGATIPQQQSQQQNHVNLQHFNYDPATQWISMPVLPAAQNQQNTHLQQVRMSDVSIFV